MLDPVIDLTVILTKVVDLTMEPTIREWWLDILRKCAWFLLKSILFIVDILYDIVMYLASLDFLSSPELAEFYNRYKILLIIFLTISMMMLGIMIMSADNNPMQKGKLKNALYGVMLVFLFSTIYPLLNQASMGFNAIIGQEETSLSVKLVQSSTKRLSYNDGKVVELRDITIEESMELLQGGEAVNNKSNFQGTKDAYDYDIGWLSISVIAFVMVFALIMLGHNTVRIILDIGWVRILSLIALPLSIVSEGARKKFILETFKTFATLPISLLAFAFFLKGSDWLMSLEIFTSSYLLKYKGTFAEGYVTALFLGISLSALTAIVLDGSSRTTGLLGIDTGIKSPAGAFALMRGTQATVGAAKGIIGLGRNTGRFAKGTAQKGFGAAMGTGRSVVSAAGFASGVNEALKDKREGRSPDDEKGNKPNNHEQESLKQQSSSRMPKNSKIDRVKNIPNRVQSRYNRGTQTGYNAVKSLNNIGERMKKRRDKQ